jgi:hypothetical protein
MRRKCNPVLYSQKYNRAICVDSYQENIIELLVDNEKYRKKSQRIDKKTWQLIEKIKYYDYEF